MYKGLSRRYTKLEQHILTVSVKFIELTEGHEVKGFGEVFTEYWEFPASSWFALKTTSEVLTNQGLFLFKATYGISTGQNVTTRGRSRRSRSHVATEQVNNSNHLLNFNRWSIVLAEQVRSSSSFRILFHSLSKFSVAFIFPICSKMTGRNKCNRRQKCLSENDLNIPSV